MPCSGACVDTKNDVLNCGQCGSDCPVPAGSTATCIDSQCGFSCNAGLSACSGQCVNTNTDKNNCGQCGKKCGGLLSCVLGLCLL